MTAQVDEYRTEQPSVSLLFLTILISFAAIDMRIGPFESPYRALSNGHIYVAHPYYRFIATAA